MDLVSLHKGLLVKEQELLCLLHKTQGARALVETLLSPPQEVTEEKLQEAVEKGELDLLNDGEVHLS